MDSWNRCKAVLLLLACVLLTACGGSGGTEGRANADSDDGTIAGLLAAPITEAQAVRFLWKSSFGPTTESIARLRQLGYARFVDEQLAMPAGVYSDYMLGYIAPTNVAAVEPREAYCAQFPTETMTACTYWAYWTNSGPSTNFFKSALTDSDQLRLRVAWALSQILVVSNSLLPKEAYGMRLYQQMLRDQAFGNYKTLLERVSKSPLMGAYLNLDSSHKDAPNQNYARELLQLFSVGAFARNPDGTFKLGANGNRVENYTQEQVRDFSRALTGWRANQRWVRDMEPFGDAHDSGSKVLLNGASIPAGTSASQAMSLVLTNVTQHPSTAPNISRQLIQFLVTSHPSPAYVARVSRVFSSTGGDLRLVTRAILLDTEALNPPEQNGKLIEPVLFLTGLLRSVGFVSDGYALDQAASAMGQRPFAAPSVFNYYSPEFELPLSSRKLKAPQFALLGFQSTSAKSQWLNTLIYSDAIPAHSLMPKALATGTRLLWPDAWLDLAGSNPMGLVAMLDTRLTGGTLSANVKQYIATRVQTISGSSSSQKIERLRLAVFLIFSSPQFLVR
ncbi:DUF1800 domain-containing protein [Limnohabitans radicicola]|uniref:DUF1800 domain-containing protein n=1 Tax=Limnohabitans radicicola TaxID=2771427 RepID=A0A927IMR5_9BURK|nr:DUF1800 family protein [Limnohabitans radicicola]MBD8052028.1 DUF1800 domain-containing protein [Limnohabitans radicicola]